jgi:hypothetical protein
MEHKHLQERWNRIDPYLKQQGWKYKKGGLDGFVYQPPGLTEWLSCEAAATLFGTKLLTGITLVLRYSGREASRGRQLKTTRNKEALTAPLINDNVRSSRPNKPYKKRKSNAFVIPET